MSYEDDHAEREVREAREERAIRLGYWTSGALVMFSALLFIIAIVMESGKTAGIGGVVVALAIITLMVTMAYHDWHDQRKERNQ